jgi:hypothetical protein
MPIAHPPTHRIDATPVYVDWDLDKAWKRAELDAETAEIVELNKGRPKDERIHLDRHPVALYKDGVTRYDPEAPVLWRGQQRCAAEWIGDGAVRFVLRRLKWDRWYECHAIGNPVLRAVHACQVGLHRVDGDEALEVDPDMDRRSYEEMQRLYAADPMLPFRIGKAVLEASRPLDDGEKKS